MYTRKFDDIAAEGDFRLPDNYAGNAFSHTEESTPDTPTIPITPLEAPKEEAPRAQEKSPEAMGESPFFLSRAPTPDILLLLLAFLLMEEGGSADLSSILLYLLLLDGSEK